MRLKFFPVPLLVGLGGLLILLIFLQHKKRKGSYLFCFAIFWVYLLILVGLTLFPIPIPTDFAMPDWKQSLPFILSSINFVPFHFGGLFSLSRMVIFRELVGNILLTLPFGFGINFITPLKAKNIPWLAVAVGVVIESTQLLISVGIGVHYRGVDINDVILNTLGVLIGYGLFRIFAWLFLRRKPQSGSQPRGMRAYLDEVARKM